MSPDGCESAETDAWWGGVWDMGEMTGASRGGGWAVDVDERAGAICAKIGACCDIIGAVCAEIGPV